MWAVHRDDALPFFYLKNTFRLLSPDPRPNQTYDFLYAGEQELSFYDAHSKKVRIILFSRVINFVYLHTFCNFASYNLKT